MLLLFMVMYSFGIFMTVMVGENCDSGIYPEMFACDDMFGGVFKSMFTMFQVMTGDSWSMEVGRMVLFQQPFLIFVIIIFLFLTTFGLMNIVMAVIVENTLAAAKDNDHLEKRRRERREKKVLDQIKALFIAADAEGNANGKMDIDEFSYLCKLPAAEQKFSYLGVPITNPKDIFTLFEQDEDDEVSMHDFFAGILKIKGEASSKDMIQLVMATGSTLARVDRMDLVCDKLNATMER